MSRAFLKNESADDPVVIPARAPLPPGATNYVTPRGLALLRAELAELEAERAHVQVHTSDEADRTRQLAELNGRIGALNQRIASAHVVDHANQDPAADPLVRFGATVTLRTRSSRTAGNTERRFTIVGVDEADAGNGRIAFTAPIARAMQGKRVGDTITLRTARGEDVMEITAINYAD
ncbi:transcription elongation factor GreAB [Spirosoma taeanense]|uniref:Transcription elongation factor GreAB n=1 Tax=Spirosoma taeanense TaxID=2735870 RepID=A0A6M5YCH8_9BACT|nr:GreA/GreB family elongation factor [Spirosoma taeanense]QJW90931.1 transcription elongation factor GreAB [Spirosoma taeanense]